MLKQIEEIQSLATKYSKAELGRMVQMGILDPQKAMMAGMMIQRITQQNAQPPQTTVAQDVLGLPAVASPEQAQPQAQPKPQAPQPQSQPQPQMQARATGIENLPAGEVGSYAGGGIVSFDDGGEVDGYAGGGVPKKSKYDELIYSAAQKANIDPEVFRRLIFTESSFNPNAVSYAGRDAGLGIAQISKHHKLTEAQRLDPKFSLGYAAKYFKGLVDKSEGDYRKALERYKGVASEKGRQRMAKAISTVLGEPYEAPATRLASVTPTKQRKPKIDTIDNPFAVREEEIAQAPAPSGITGIGDINHLALLSTPYAQQNDYEMPEDAVGGFAGGGLAAFAGGGVPGYNGDPKTGSVVADPISEQLRGSELYNTRAKFDALQKKLAVEEAKAAQGDKAAARDALEIRQEMERVWRALGTPNTVKAGDLVGQGFRKDQMLPPPSRGYGQNIAERAQEHSNADLAKNIVDVEKRLATETDPSKRAYLETRKKALLAEQKAAAPAPALAPAPAPALATSNPPTSGPNYVAPTVPAFAPPANTGNRPSPPPANTAYQPPAAQLPPIDRPNVGKKSFADYVKETTPTIEALPKPDVEELPALATKRKDAYAAEGYDPDMYNKRIAALEEKREAAGGGRERAIGEAIMTAGLKLMGARRGQEFQALSEGAQEGLKSYQAAVKDIKSLQEKYDERMDAYRMADMQARKTGVDTDMARRDSQLAAVKAVEAKLFEARNDATKVGIQTAAQMTNADKQLFASTYSTNVGAQTAREYTGALKEQQIEASKAKILVDAAGDYITKNASNPKYMQNPEQLQTDAVAYANSIGAQLGIIPKGANFAPPPSPDANYYKENFGVTPTR